MVGQRRNGSGSEELSDEQWEEAIAVQNHKHSVIAFGCVVCRRLGHGYVAAVPHHMRHGVGTSQRNDDWHMFGLCPRHHTDGGHGFAIHAGQETWEKLYGTETELLCYMYQHVTGEIPAWIDQSGTIPSTFDRTIARRADMSGGTS